MRRNQVNSILAGAALALLSSSAMAGGIRDNFAGGAFGVPWNASKAGIQGKYPGGQWGTDEKGREEYCVASRQTLLKLPAQHQTQRLCFSMGADGTLGSATAHMNASLPTLLAVVMRSKTYFGDFDAVQRDESAIQSKSTNMLWTREKPLLVKVASTNDDDGKPVAVAFTVTDEAAVHSQGAAAVSNVPKAGQ